MNSADKNHKHSTFKFYLGIIQDHAVRYLMESALYICASVKYNIAIYSHKASFISLLLARYWMTCMK